MYIKMPILDTKYNEPWNYNDPPTKLHAALKNNSLTYTNHILTCDISDTLIDDDITKPNATYLTNKAAFLIHPFTHCRNSVTQFNNENPIFRLGKPCKPQVPNATSSHNTIQTQKAIQKQISSSASNYTGVLKSTTVAKDLHINPSQKLHNNASDRIIANGRSIHEIQNANLSTSILPNKGVDIKHNSYDRYLAKKKGNYLRTQTEANAAPIAKIGNKTRNFSLLTQASNCPKNC
jgi:hypothetical protein